MTALHLRWFYKRLLYFFIFLMSNDINIIMHPFLSSCCLVTLTHFDSLQGGLTPKFYDASMKWPMVFFWPSDSCCPESCLLSSNLSAVTCFLSAPLTRFSCLYLQVTGLEAKVFFFFSLFRPKLWTRQEQCYSRLVHKCLYSAWSLSFCSRSVLATQQKILQPIKFQLWTCGRFHVSFVSLLVLFTRYCCSLQFYFASFGLEKIHPCSRRVFFCVWDHWHIFVQLTLCSMYDVVLSPWYYANLCPMYNITLLHV